MVQFSQATFFNSVRASLFSNKLSQKQVEGMSAILGEFERRNPGAADMRFLAYALATTYHETSKEMQPIEEYGKGKGMAYGKMDPETKQTYYGRGFVQLTWRDNYAKADRELGLKGDTSLEWHASNALLPQIAADVMFEGMEEGWFRSDTKGKQTLKRYFSTTVDNPYEAREIINGDRKTVPSWSNGVSIGNLIKDYHQKFLTALVASVTDMPVPPEPKPDELVTVGVNVPEGISVTLFVNGEQVYRSS